MTISDIVSDINRLLENSIPDLSKTKKNPYERGKAVGYREGLKTLRYLLTTCPDFQNSNDICPDADLDNVLKRGVY